MYEHDLLLQTQHNPGEIYRGLLRAVSSARFSNMTAAVAYASDAGCRLLIEGLEANMRGWDDAQKRWLVSLEQGITTPGALSLLGELPNSAVRVVGIDWVTEQDAVPGMRFHNKLYLFESRVERQTLGLFSGSANLTLSGLYRNSEQATLSIWTPPLAPEDVRHWDQARSQRVILNQMFASATPVDEDLINRYRATRPSGARSEDSSEFTRRVAQTRPVMPLRKAVAIGAASSFWIEVNYVVPNLGRDRPGNQIELQKGSRVFFGFGVGEVPRNTPLGTVPIRVGDEVVDCRMRYGNNQMDKLNLPVPGALGPATYEYHTLRFERGHDATFALTIGSVAEVAAWKHRSSRQGTLFRLQGGREYGVFS